MLAYSPLNLALRKIPTVTAALRWAPEIPAVKETQTANTLQSYRGEAVLPPRLQMVKTMIMRPTHSATSFEEREYPIFVVQSYIFFI